MRRLKLLFVALLAISVVLMLGDLADHLAPWLQIAIWIARIFAFAAIIPVVILFRRQWDREQRIRTGCCIQCGYRRSSDPARNRRRTRSDRAQR